MSQQVGGSCALRAVYASSFEDQTPPSMAALEESHRDLQM